MKIALTGGSGRIGRVIVTQALAQGHSVINIDRLEPPEPQEGVPFVLAEMNEYDKLVETFAGCDAVIHMAAIPSPGRHPDHVVHNNNVVGSYNALRAAAEHGIKRVCQASSVNAIGHNFSRAPHYDYFPIDENHPTYTEDPYSLSKWMCEQQADSFVRRYEGMRIASLRFHYVTPERAEAAERFNQAEDKFRHRLWAYTRRDAAARACLLSLTADFEGHEAFFIIAPDTTSDEPSRALAAKYLPEVPIRGEFAGNCSFFDSSKAGRILGWEHPRG